MQVTDIFFIDKIKCGIAGNGGTERKMTHPLPLLERGMNTFRHICQFQQAVDIYMFLNKLRHAVGKLFEAKILIQRKP